MNERVKSENDIGSKRKGVKIRSKGSRTMEKKVF